MRLEHIRPNIHEKATDEERAIYRRLMPVDMYLYEYARQLLKMRWKWYIDNVKLRGQGQYSLNMANEFKMPEVIDGCRSTREKLMCPQRMLPTWPLETVVTTG